MTDKETQVKRFVAPSMSRALELVREEMGPEAVILSSKKVEGGVEIVTSLELDLPTRGISERRSFGQNFDTELDHAMESDVSWESQAGIEQAASNYGAKLELNGPSEQPKAGVGEGLALEIERARERMLEAKRQAAEEGRESVEPKGFSSRIEAAKRSSQSHTQQTTPSHQHQTYASQSSASSERTDPHTERKLEGLKGEIADLRMLLEQQMWSKPAEREIIQPVQAPVASVGVNNSNDVLIGHLARLGLSDDIMSNIGSEVSDKLRISDAWKQSLARLARKIPIAPNLDIAHGGAFAFIGPTGVGKTTTIAKLAAQYSVANGPGKVALISMDTHRVGAVEQLKALGRILDAPVRTVTSSSGLMTTLAGLRDFPLLLIDTAGFRHGDPLLKAQLAQLDQNPSVKRMLVLSSLSQLQTLKASIHAYRPRPGTDGCVLSKLDEASSLGEALSAVIQHTLNVAYVTDGQQIPKDVHIANAANLVATAVKLAKQGILEHSASV